MRSIRDLTPEQRSMYQIWQNRLKDRTLSAEQHDECRREIDNLLWKGPNAKVLELKAALDELEDRIARVEFHLGLADDELPELDKIRTEGADDERPELDKIRTEVRADCGNTLDVKDPEPNKGVPPSERHDNLPKKETRGRKKLRYTVEKDPKKETRGRKKLRYTVEKDANRHWNIVDRHKDEYTDHSPFKTKREAKEVVDALNRTQDAINAIDNPPAELPWPRPPKVYHDGDGVIRDKETGKQAEITTVIVPGMEVETPEGPIGFDEDPLEDPLDDHIEGDLDLYT